ncbi:uncharacterized protein LOC125584272 [Brassica napus]|uniref:uncharacterized protein LOC125584272 n=1 Tax=Brassica napus TaxID=3708 RepID=UPI0020790155|nr:uncharacterized protein LOC125584272 [Brassica napus]
MVGKRYFTAGILDVEKNTEELLGNGGCMGMGITMNAKVEDCIHHRRKNHRVVILNRIEVEIEKFKENRNVEEDDIYLWRSGNDKYRRKFLTTETWQVIRKKHQVYDWHKAIWFKNATPKYAFVTWVAMRDRLSTGSRMVQWNANVDASCILCQTPMETVGHLFFECPFSEQIWRNLARGVMRERYTSNWSEIVRVLMDEKQDKLQLFTIRYLFLSIFNSSEEEG